MRFKDRTNIKYGKLTAIEYLGKSMWKCKCECGNEIIVYGGHLESGHTKSCGCFRPPRIKLYNQTFGRLTVLDWEGQGKWLCQCECGNQVSVKTGNLQNGNTQSCGCYQRDQTSKACFQSLVGKKYGKLTVIERAENDRFDQVQYKCLCDCGGITIVSASNLRNGITNSCGCLKSKGEMIINNWLQKHKINFISQYSHSEIILESGRRPFFDFAIFNLDGSIKCFIEYNGKQHYQVTGGWNTKEQFELTVNRDKQKREWCKKLNIPLYEIKYTDDIEKALEGIIKDSADAPDMEEAEEIIKENSENAEN